VVALERRFQKVGVRELSAAETLDVLRARAAGLERHHNVVITDDALSASLELTDIYVTDRMRPDRAIDALDEACAHAHAGADYTPTTERLVVERRELLRHAARAAEGGATAADRNGGGGADAAELVEVERFAREGIAALERFGAEVEAMLGMPQPERPAAGAAGAPAEGATAPYGATAAPGGVRRVVSRVAELDVELRRRLAEEGVVVRGYDVARVVALSCNCNVRWPVA